MSRLERAGHVAEIVGSLTLAIGAVVAFWQYQASVRADRVEHVLELAKEFDSGDYLKAQTLLEAALRRASDDRDAIAGDRMLAARAAERRFFARLDADRERDGLAMSTALVVGFFEKVSICADANVCDPQLTRAYFSSYAHGLAVALACHIQSERKRERTYATGLLSVGGATADALDRDDRCRLPDAGDPAGDGGRGGGASPGLGSAGG